MSFVIPQVDHVSKIIGETREDILEERNAENRKKKIANDKIQTIAYLSTRTDKMMAQYELSSRYVTMS